MAFLQRPKVVVVLVVCRRCEQMVLPARLQKLVGELSLLFAREICREFCGIFSDPQNQGLTFSGNFGAFRKKFRASKDL